MKALFGYRKLPWLKGLAAIFTLLALGLLTLIWTSRIHYENRLREQIWTDSAPQTSVVSNTPEGLARTVLFLGDSRMAQWSLPPLAQWQMVNAGTPGFTTKQTLLSTPSLLDRFHPSVVVLQVGINDLKYLGLRPEMISEIVSLALTNIAGIVHECARRKCNVLLLTVWPASQPTLARRLVWSPAVASGVVLLNEKLQALNSPQNKIRVVDLFNDGKLNLKAGFYRDTLHLTPSAYQLLTPLLEKELGKCQGN